MHARWRKTITGALAVPLILTGIFVPSAALAVDGDDTPENTAPSLTDRVAEAADAGATAPEELAAEVALPVDGSGSLIFDGVERVTASVVFDGTPTAETIAAVEEIAEITALMESFGVATVRVAPDRLTELTAIAGVVDATPALQPTTSSEYAQVAESLRGALPAAPTDAAESCSSVPAEADGPLRSGEAKDEFGALGQGVTIGILSDTFDKRTAPTSWADDVLSGALPGPGNPCGWETPVELLPDRHESTWNDSDEGRGMAQLVHSIAPAATIMFADSGDTMYEMAANIQGLANAGADIIVDDITFYHEAYYQKDLLSVVIDQVRASGIGYFSSAGNATVPASTGEYIGEPINSWQTRSFRPMACPSWVEVPTLPEGAEAAECLDFDPGAGEQAYDTFRTAAVSGLTSFPLDILGSIAEPVNGVTTPYLVQLYQEVDGEDPVLLDTIESFGGAYPGLLGRIPEVPVNADVRMVTIRAISDSADTHNPALFIGFTRNAGLITEREHMGDGVHDWVGESAFGHNGNGSAISVGSLEWDDPETVREYSSLGPTTRIFEDSIWPIDATGVAPYLPGAVIVNAPAVAGVDGLATTFFGADADGVYRFYGTSAAAPTAAAVAGLGLSYNPELGGNAASELTVETARGTDEGGPVNPYNPERIDDQNVFGNGIVDALALLERIDADAPVPAAPQGVTVDQDTITDTSATISWEPVEGAFSYWITTEEVEPGDTAGTEATDTNVALAAARSTTEDGAQALADEGVIVEDGSDTSAEVVGLQPETTYLVQVVAISAMGKVSDASDPVEFTTLASVTPGPTPGPTPTPTPTPDNGGSGTDTTPSGTSNAGALSHTGDDGSAPLIIGAIVLVLLGAATVTIALVRKRGAAAAGGSGSAGTGTPQE